MYVDILILAHLAARPHHGYEIKKNVERVLGPEFTLNNGMLYPALRRFEEMGAVERVVERQQGKPDRHIYRLSDLGHEILHDMLTEFPQALAHSETEFFVRVAFFDQLEPHEQRASLSTRTTVLRSSLENHDRILTMVRAEDVPMSPYALETMVFRKQQVEQELAWIERLMRSASDDATSQSSHE